MNIFEYIANFKFLKNEWEFIDLRIDIPRESYGSDAINKHTQYSNPVAVLNKKNTKSFGAGFTLGDGNDLVCEAADKIINLWDGKTINTMKEELSCYEFLQNPNQLRWLGPNCGLIPQAIGLIMNTLCDHYCREHKKPLWKAFLMAEKESKKSFYGRLNNLSFYPSFENNFKNSKSTKLRAYHTTWIGFSEKDLCKEIANISAKKGISLFKLKIDSNTDYYMNKISNLVNAFDNKIEFAVDANQVLTFEEACSYLKYFDKLGIKWIEEPFAPDNLVLFSELIKFKQDNNISMEIVSGENCPSPHVCEALVKTGIDRFQADPCRMIGFIDVILVSEICEKYNIHLTPHAGGSCLDEMSNHISHYHHRRNGDKFCGDDFLENVGFCSWLLKDHTHVLNGFVVEPKANIFLGDFEDNITSKFRDYKEGVTWLKL